MTTSSKASLKAVVASQFEIPADSITHLAFVEEAPHDVKLFAFGCKLRPGIYVHGLLAYHAGRFHTHFLTTSRTDLGPEYWSQEVHFMEDSASHMHVVTE